MIGEFADQGLLPGQTRKCAVVNASDMLFRSVSTGLDFGLGGYSCSGDEETAPETQSDDDLAEGFVVPATDSAMARRTRARVYAVLGRMLQEAEPPAHEANTFPTVEPIDEFLDTLYRFAETGRTKAGISFVFNTVNDWLCKGQTKLCDKILEMVDVNKIGVDLTLSFLTITMAAREQLAQRPEYCRRAWKAIAQVRGRSVARRLLENLA